MENIVQTDPSSTIYVFERKTWWERTQNVSSPNYYLIATSDKTPTSRLNNVTYVRIPVLNTTTVSIKNSAKYIIDNKILTDTSFLWTDSTTLKSYSVSVQNLDFTGLKWAIVVLSDFSPDANVNCIRKYDEDVLNGVKANIDNYLDYAVSVGSTMKKGLDFGVINATSPPLPGYGNSNVQYYFHHLFRVYNARGFSRVHMGREDNSFLSYGYATGSVGSTLYEAYSFRAPDVAGQNIMRDFYHTQMWDGNVKDTTPFKNTTYDLKARPWYVNAKAYKKPFFTDVYVGASDGKLTVSFIVPFFAVDGVTFAGTFGMDIFLEGLSAVLKDFDKNGFMTYIMEAKANMITSNPPAENPDAYKLVAVSNACPVNNTYVNGAKLEPTRVNAVDAESFYVAKSAAYFKAHDTVAFREGDMTTAVDSSVSDLTFEETRLKYAYSNLRWDLVTTEQLYPTVTAPTSCPKIGRAHV